MKIKYKDNSKDLRSKDHKGRDHHKVNAHKVKDLRDRETIISVATHGIRKTDSIAHREKSSSLSLSFAVRPQRETSRPSREAQRAW